ncbi:MAG: dual specificity protein phosphatase family protein [Nitrososphaerales archaeon]
MSRREFEWIVKQEKIRAILSLTETPLDPEWTKQLVYYKNIQVPNHKAPTVEQLKEAVKFLEENVVLKNKVLVHCAAGKGRTGTVLAAYLCERQEMSPNDAIAKIRSQRHGSVEKNSGQEEAVFQFAKFLQSHEQKK